MPRARRATRSSSSSRARSAACSQGPPARSSAARAAAPTTGCASTSGSTGVRMTSTSAPWTPWRPPSASYKLPGAETLTVDLLAPGERVGEIVPVQELGTHAQTIPLLDFLVAGAVPSVVLSPNQVVPVKLPTAERFALHKLFSSQRRGSDRAKGRKDLEQAAVLVTVLEEESPGLLGDAWRE